jgi:hypothetical protein
VSASVDESVRRRLILVARAGKTITYGDLMREFGIPRGHRKPGVGIGHVVGRISEAEWDEDRPMLSAIVVRAGTATSLCPKGHTGGGFFGQAGIPARLRRNEKDWDSTTLSIREQELVRQEQENVWRYWKGSRSLSAILLLARRRSKRQI